ncbi:MAG: hypothetical protein ABI414_03965, partial [Devosia sp.]
MATQEQLAASVLYANIMAEVKYRTDAIDAGTGGKLPLSAPLIREFCYLQLRMICELIALGCLVTAIVHGMGPPFTFRLGQRPPREVRVLVPEFQRLNQKKTNAERQEEVDQIAPSMVNDPAPILDLASRLDDL